MKRVERVTESEASVTVGELHWSVGGWKADLIGAIVVMPFVFFFVVGAVTVVGWFR